MRVYVGLLTDGGREVFRSPTRPTQDTHGHRYAAVVGPFKTARAARFTASHAGRNNPHVRCVADAERITQQGEG